MKKLAVMFVLGLTLTGTSFAQTIRQPNQKQDKTLKYESHEKQVFKRGKNQRPVLSAEERATRHTEMLSQKLDLSKNQKKKLQALNLKQAQQMQALNQQYAQGGGPKNAATREERKQLRANWEKDFKRIVSKKQYAQYEAQRNQMQAKRGKHFGKEDHSNFRFRKPING
ncbi:hypothetical protein HUW51_19305 [Adhaeribacter swui]|uniref:DUF4890 domain-containing protein n=1 Tax=Adhaeribacter swui TaxID=2086471 RepID=A0A7G7GC86_9BACT|nr:hypothetical protein [Adhaeribacter swui]QNF34770.1 hypothetical protein HUW51_19305 [Adhaeribacter swui]